MAIMNKNQPCTSCTKQTNECPICYENFHSTDKNELFTTTCNHTFHKSCLFKWNKPSCPMCRSVIPISVYAKPLISSKNRDTLPFPYSYFKENKLSTTGYRLCGRIMSNEEYNVLHNALTQFSKQHTLTQLKQLCKQNGKKVTGCKMILCRRLKLPDYLG